MAGSRPGGRPPFLHAQERRQRRRPNCAAGFAGALSTPGAGGSCRELTLRAQTGDTTIPAVAGLRSAAQKGKGVRARLRHCPLGWHFVGRVSTRQRSANDYRWRVETRPTKTCAAVADGHPIPLCRAERSKCGAETAASLSEPAGRVCEAARPVLAEGGKPEGPRQWGVLLCLAFLHEQESRSPAGARPGQRPHQEMHSPSYGQKIRTCAPCAHLSHE